MLVAYGYGAGYLLALLVVLAVAFRSRVRFPMHTGVRVLLALGFAAAMAAPAAAAIVTGVVVVVCFLHEPTIRAALPEWREANVPGLGPARGLTMPMVVRVHLALLLLMGAVAGLGASPWLALVPAALWAAGVAVVVLVSMRGEAIQSADERRRAALERWRPEFVLHFSGPADATHQVLMWLPYLQRVGARFLVVVREQPAFEALAPAGVPVVLAASLPSLESCVVDSLRAAFYVNNGMKNTHLVRFAHLTHVQLLHGDSEKPPSFSPVTAMYDKVFVAGQAGRDRYATHGVDIPDEKFVIVGRPQVEAITTGPLPGGGGAATVLYAPTWQGQYEDSNYCSLPIGAEIVSSLLDAGARVVFRAHPFSASDPVSAAQVTAIEERLAEHRRAGGPDHLFGPRASEPDIIEIYNLADALVADLSSVVSDYLFSGRPFAVTNMHDDVGFAAKYPIVAAAYPVPSDAAGAAEQWAQMLGPDPLREQRQQVREYYLGPFPAQGYADAFVAAARAVVEAGSSRQRSEHVEEEPLEEASDPDELAT